MRNGPPESGGIKNRCDEALAAAGDDATPSRPPATNEQLSRLVNLGGAGGARTHDPGIMSPML